MANITDDKHQTLCSTIIELADFNQNVTGSSLFATERIVGKELTNKKISVIYLHMDRGW